MIPISEDELTQFVATHHNGATKMERGEARRLARLMLASEQMYEALKRNYEWLCTGEAQRSAYHVTTYRITEAALVAAEGNQRGN